MLATAFFSQSTLRFALLGAASGSLTALVALSIVIVHRVSGVLNFSAGALGAVGAFACYSLLDSGWPTGAAVGAGLLIGAGLGCVTYGVMAMLRNSSLLSRLIATLALWTGAQSALAVFWTDQISQPKSLLPSRSITIAGDLRIGEDRLILIGLVLVLAVALRAIYSGTLFGLATSAVSESRRVAAIARWSPSRIELANYMIAGFLAALAAILLAPIVTLNAAILSVAVLPALAAALIGRFSSFALTVLAALAIGVVQSELSLFQPDIASAFSVSQASLTGLSEAVPLLIILIATVLSGRARPDRGDATTRLPLPGSGRVAKPALLVALVTATALIVAAPTYADALITTFGMAIVLSSVVVVSGYAGQLSLCQYALAGFGAWVAAQVASSFDAPFIVAAPIGVIACVLVGVLVALPALRTRGVTLAIITLALALVFNSLIFENAGMTGGFEGIKIKSPALFGLDLDPIAHPQRYAALLLLVLVGVGLVVANLRTGSTGRQLIAVRSNERAAAALGINVIAVKVYAFAVGAGIAALGGILIAFRQTNVQFHSFNVFGSILLVEYAVVGGIGWISGVVAGAAASPGALVTQLANDVLPDLHNVGAWIAIASGLSVIALLRRAPDGVASIWARVAVRIMGRRVRSRRAGPPSPPRQRRQPRALDVRGVSVSFGGVVAVDDVSFSVAPGEVVGLIGPNGAGKTTLLDVITGFTRQASGTVMFGEDDVSSWSPERRARAGIARSWQAVELFEELTVLDNILVAEESRSLLRYGRDLLWPSGGALSEFALSVVDGLDLRHVLDERPTTLPHGVTKRVGIARAVVSNPGVVLLDEPAAGLDNEESGELATVIRNIATEHGVGVVVIEHDLALILAACDRIVVLDFGRKIADGSPESIQADSAVVDAYLGASTGDLVPTSAPALLERS